MCGALSRRSFIGKASVGLGAGTFGLPLALNGSEGLTKMNRKPPEVWIGTVSSDGLSAENPSEMIGKMLNILEVMVPFHPDILCLPETFAFSNVADRYQLREAAEAFSGTLFAPLRNFAGLHKCYLICPTYILKNDSVYNAAVLINRKGEIVGEYLKMHPAESEIEAGIRPGPLDPPVFEADFGKIGIQICYDVKWDDGWSRLKQQGAEIIFWPSAYPAGKEICSKAWQHQVYVVSSTRKGITRICDISGEVIANTGFWQPNYTCAPVNPEKVLIPTWPYVSEFPAIIQKYNKKINIRTFDEEEWTIIESLDAELKIEGIISEFGLKTQYRALTDVEKIQKLKR